MTSILNRKMFCFVSVSLSYFTVDYPLLVRIFIQKQATTICSSLFFLSLGATINYIGDKADWLKLKNTCINHDFNS
jgi:hypothetical protein